MGHLIQVMVLRRFQRAGHRPIALVGGATGMIGDPSGKSAERNLLAPDVLEANVVAVGRQLRRFLEFGAGPGSALLVDNLDWMGSCGLLAFLRDVGKHVGVGTMLGRESVRSRLDRSGSGLSFTEFSYQLLQAYDFVHLFDAHGCGVQAGGSDQWGNIAAGVDLARRMRSVRLHGLTCPLLTRSDGSKMGKTEGGALWLDPGRTSPFRFYQYWLNVADADVGRCLRFLTDLGREEIEAMEARHAAAPERREAQKRLASELALMVHGREGLDSVLRATGMLFGEAFGDISDQDVEEIFAEVPSRTVSVDRLRSHAWSFSEALVACGLARSRAEARRQMAQGGIYLNNRRLPCGDRPVGPGDLASPSALVLRAGKRHHAVIRFVEGPGDVCEGRT